MLQELAQFHSASHHPTWPVEGDVLFLLLLSILLSDVGEQDVVLKCHVSENRGLPIKLVGTACWAPERGVTTEADRQKSSTIYYDFILSISTLRTLLWEKVWSLTQFLLCWLFTIWGNWKCEHLFKKRWEPCFEIATHFRVFIRDYCGLGKYTGLKRTLSLALTIRFRM